MLRRPALIWLAAGTLWTMAAALVFVRANLPRDGVWVSVFFSRQTQPVVVAAESDISLQPGDLILSLNGQPLSAWALAAISQPMNLAAPWQAGQSIRYQVQRGSTQFEASIMLQPGAFKLPTSRWGGVLFGVMFQLVTAFLFLKRPQVAATAVLFLAAASSASYLIIRSLETQVGEMLAGWTQLLFLGGGLMAYTVFFASCVHIAGVFPQRHALLVRQPRLVPALYITAFGAVLVSIAARWPIAGDFFQWLHAQANLWVLGAAASLAITIALSVSNYRACTDPIKRLQARWVSFAIVISLLWAVLTYYLPNALERTGLVQWSTDLMLLLYNVAWLAALSIPIAFAIAILRHRLFDIDLIINRALVYGALTLFVVGIYVFIVGVIGVALEANGNLWLSLFTTGLIAVLFQPLRERVQQRVNRWMYGERDDPYAVLSRLGQQLESTLATHAVLPMIVETVAQTLKLPYVAITLREHASDQFALAEAYGHANVPDQHILPLMYQADTIGQLIVTPRSATETFTPAEQRLLVDLARQAGLAVHAVQAETALHHARELLVANVVSRTIQASVEAQQSRERIIAAREEERRRLRRDLHDGVGPTLAALGLKAGSLRHVIPNDPATAVVQATELRDQIRGVIADIRRAVYDLRPPALDELGLIQALREQAAQSTSQGLHVSVEAPEPMPALSAAVEVAVYRITLEALTNVLRHAGAQRCQIKMSVGADLELTISDDGHGLAESQRSGVGLVSMRERATELGGTFKVESSPAGGTVIRVNLPLGREAAPQQSEG